MNIFTHRNKPIYNHSIEWFNRVQSCNSGNNLTTKITGLKNHEELLERSIVKVAQMKQSGKVDIPPFQRKETAWVNRQIQILIFCIINGLRIPVIDSQRFSDGSIDLIDGQQRCFNAIKFIKNKIRIDNPKTKSRKFKEHKDFYSKYGGRRFSRLPKNIQQKVKDYPLKFSEEISDDEGDGRDYYVRANTLGSKINRPEINRAYHYDTAFWKQAHNLSSKYAKFFYNSGVLTEAKIGRSEDQLLIQELLVLIRDGAQSSGKLKKYFENWRKDIPNRKETVDEMEKIFNHIQKIFPKGLVGTRFDNTNNFYALVGALSAKLKTSGKLKNPKTVNSTLTRFMGSVFNGRSERQARPYWETLQEGTKSKANRKVRISILCGKI